MAEIQQSKKGLAYVAKVLKTKATVVTRAFLWGISHKTTDTQEVSLKLGRYRRGTGTALVPETENPKSELTLEGDEFEALLEFLRDNYEPFKSGVRRFVPITDDFDPTSIAHLRALFAGQDRAEVIKFVADNRLLPPDLVAALQHLQRRQAMVHFTHMLGDAALPEQTWQTWFKDNSWILGSEFVEILDDRRIDESHVADYLMRAHDGFLDLVEIKKPSSDSLWAPGTDHGNNVPSSALTKAIMQANKYLFELERESNSLKFRERLGAKVIKPRCTLIFGRSMSWTEGQREDYRVLNASLHNLTILTYDHVYARAMRMLGDAPQG